MVVTGDVTQVDLPREQKSGLIVVGDILEGIEGVEFVRFGGDDVVRHKLVQRIVEAYDQHDAGQASGACAPAQPDHRRRTRLAVLDVEVIGARCPRRAWSEAVAYAAASAGIDDGHVAVEFVDAERIAELNAQWRGKAGPTDVLSFPVDEDDGPVLGERELGDVVICPEHTEDLLEAVVHGVLHLTGMDHETDEGEMLALQAEIRSWLSMTTRSGFVALAGRPNVGKSTLVNAMVGHKVAIVSDKPQTTRRAIRGVLTVPDQYQLVLTDLPGVQRPRDALTARMQRRVESERGGGRRGAVRRQRRPGRRRRGRPLHRRGAGRRAACRS